MLASDDIDNRELLVGHKVIHCYVVLLSTMFFSLEIHFQCPKIPNCLLVDGGVSPLACREALRTDLSSVVEGNGSENRGSLLFLTDFNGREAHNAIVLRLMVRRMYGYAEAYGEGK